MTEDLLERIEINPDVMLGKPVIRGTRIPVEILLEKIAAGIPMEEILRDYPRLLREDVLAAVAYARCAIGREDKVCYSTLLFLFRSRCVPEAGVGIAWG